MNANQKRFLYTDVPRVNGVYSITNTVNNKMYIGFSKEIKRRINEHYLQLIKGCHFHYGKDLQKDWNQNSDCWVVKVLEVTDDKHKEEFWINYYKSNISGYNDSIGTKLSEHRIEECRQTNLGRVRSEETKQLIRDANLGKTQSSETIEKRRLKLIGKVRTEETKLKMRKPKSDITRQKNVCGK